LSQTGLCNVVFRVTVLLVAIQHQW